MAGHGLRCPDLRNSGLRNLQGQNGQAYILANPRLVTRSGGTATFVDTAISQINPALTVQGYPAFLTRKTDSVVNVHSGQTIVLSGLIHATGANSINKLPWLGDIPILGTLFRDTQFQHDQSELVIFVTPTAATDQPASSACATASSTRSIQMKVSCCRAFSGMSS